MKKDDIYSLVFRVAVSILVVGLVGLIFESDNSLAYRLGHAIFVGTIVGVVFYIVEKRRTRE